MAYEHLVVDGNRGSGKFIIGVNDPNLSNETIVMAPISGDDYADGLPSGTVIAKITAVGATQGQFGPFDPAASDGRQLVTALGLLYHDAPVSAAALKNVGVFRHQVVNGNLITYAEAATSNQKAAAEAGLATSQVIVRR